MNTEQTRLYRVAEAMVQTLQTYFETAFLGNLSPEGKQIFQKLIDHKIQTAQAMKDLLTVEEEELLNNEIAEVNLDNDLAYQDRAMHAVIAHEDDLQVLLPLYPTNEDFDKALDKAMSDIIEQNPAYSLTLFLKSMQ